MHVPAPKKSKDIVITISTDVRKVARGHQSHRGGGGKHKHKCDTRLGTRNARNRAAMDS